MNQAHANSHRNLPAPAIDSALSHVYFAFLEVRLAALFTDPSRYRVERQVIADTIDVEGYRGAGHLPMTENAIHRLFP